MKKRCTLNVEDIRAFVPSKDYSLSSKFYKQLGFNLVYEADDLSIFEQGECSFILQNFYNEELANNLMLQLMVKDIGKAAEHIQKVDVITVKTEGPVRQPWGLVLYMWGPSGELWHITQYED